MGLTKYQKNVISAVRNVLTLENLFRLFLCIIVDVIGCLSYLVPGLGETSDIVWAPIRFIFIPYSVQIYSYFYSGICIRKLLPDTRLSALAYIGIFEELMPGLDFIPTATCGWFYLQYITIKDAL